MRDFETHRFKSSDGVHVCHCIIMRPDGEPRGVLQISHGMCEYIERYTDFMSFMADNGFVVCGNDHLGHGKTAEMPDELGYFSPKDGWLNAVKDLRRLTVIMKKQYPDLPFFMLGHSMGSFLARAYAVKYGRDLNAFIFMGTADGFEAAVLDIEKQSDGDPKLVEKILGGREKKIGAAAITAMLATADGIKKVRGEYYRSPLLAKMGFGKYNDRIEDPKTGYEWISHDKDIVEKYAADPLCNYSFTVNGYINLASVLWYISDDRWYQNIPKDIPILLMSGLEDPVGDYGAAVEIVYKRLKDYQADVSLKLYEGCRHELLNETERANIYLDVLDFFTSNLVRGKKPDEQQRLTEENVEAQTDTAAEEKAPDTAAEG